MNEHNPIMVRLDEMVKVWKTNVQPQHTLIRWMLKPEESRMYEGFCRLEASAHGKLDNLFVFFYTPFTQAETYSYELIQNWLHEYEDAEQQKALRAAGVAGSWEVSLFQKAVAAKDYAGCDELLPGMIQLYRNWVNMPTTPFVFGLLPKQMSDPRQFRQWVQRWMEQLRPTGTQLLLFDHIESNYWGEVFEQYRHEAVTLRHDLRMQEAIRQIATSGHNTDPHAFFRKCMFEMGDASSKKNKPLLNTWGEKGIEVAKKSGDKVLLATAYITYAGMLFPFRDHIAIEELLDTGIRLCSQEIMAGEETMKPMLLQYYTYKGASYQVQKERKEALQWFMKAGDEAVQFGFAGQAVSAYYKAYVFAEYKNYREESITACRRALQLTGRLTTEEIQSSEYPFMAYDLVKQERTQDASLIAVVEQKMVEAFDHDWQHTVAELKKNYTKKKLRQAEAGVEI
jgi:tetratricopeptide (TPR) repeat protein